MWYTIEHSTAVAISSQANDALVVARGFQKESPQQIQEPFKGSACRTDGTEVVVVDVVVHVVVPVVVDRW